MHLSLLFSGLLSLVAVHAAPVDGPAQTCTMVHKPKPKAALRCGWHGPLDPARVSPLHTPITVEDLASCADLCRTNHECISFGFSGDQCQMYNKSLLNMNITPPNISNNTSTVFYNRGCWERRCSTTPSSCLCTAKVTGIVLLVMNFWLRANSCPETIIVVNSTTTRQMYVDATTTQSPAATTTSTTRTRLDRKHDTFRLLIRK